MRNTDINLNVVADSISKRKLKFDNVKQDFTKVAFDIYRKNDGTNEELWQIQNADDGSEYIVALYDEDKIVTASVKSNWFVSVAHDDLHVFYKNEHMCKIAAKDLGFNALDLNLAKNYLPKKLAENKNFAQSLLKLVEPKTLKSIISKYPELA